MTFNKVLLSWIVILIITTSIYLFWQLGDINDVFNQSILINVRLPRLLEALLTGMILTVAGLIFQTVLNNALADSFTLGLASGATFGSGLALFLGLTTLWIPVFSITFSLITLITVLVITSVLSQGYPVRILILSGLMIGALFNSLVGIIGFIGMVIPQLIRKWQWKQSLGRQLALNIVIGGQIMVMADFIGSHILSPVQIPASIIIALIGIPVLFYMLISQSKRLH
ncbi:TPA: iron chelate uptake ABC transporter family permease subunit [Staphylococcus aureus]|nr:iron chelate uptake ABC transporter family permease subunit [Staphylococcus aureus]